MEQRVLNPTEQRRVQPLGAAVSLLEQQLKEPQA